MEKVARCAFDKGGALFITVAASVGVLAFSALTTSAQAPSVETLAPVKPAPAAGGSKGGDAALRKRIEQLEAQIVDMQVVIGTLESLARSGGPRQAAPSSSGGFGGGTADQGRLEAMETQIRALTVQIEQLSRAVNGGGGLPPGQRSDLSTPPATAGSASEAYVGTFGATTVTSDNLGNGAAGGFGAGSGRPEGPQSWGELARPRVAALDDVKVDPKQLYERAYGSLLQQNYEAAQSGFSDFLRRFPQDKLAADALYWLGEVHFVQRNYMDAAEAFDLVATTYRTSRKAADAQLKRGVSLARLGKTREACAAWKAVGRNFPKATVRVKSKANAERQRAGCS